MSVEPLGLRVEGLLRARGQTPNSMRTVGGPSSDDWLGSPAAATYLGVSQRLVYKLADQGDLRGYKLGRVIRFRRVDLDAYLEANVIQPGDLTHLRADQQPDGNRRDPTG